MSAAISVKNVAKRFRLFDTPTQRLLEYVHPFGKQYGRDFWALENVEFEVAKGETLGILGRNGSGKSTLLQLICGVLKPTRGTIDVEGRVAALLELGAGFNPDFTGRENAEFFCLQNGLAKQETSERIEEIADFADIGEFFDRPMRLYSSGMFVRVAFAASIHVDPDVLVVDEALAVGDARFQRKCFERIQHLQNSGATIIVVTHDLEAVIRHCSRALIVDEGRILVTGSPRAVVARYHELQSTGVVSEPVPEAVEEADIDPDHIVRFWKPGKDDVLHLSPAYNADEHRYGDSGARIVDCLIVDDQGRPAHSTSASRLSVVVKVHHLQACRRPVYGLGFYKADGSKIYGTNTDFLACNPDSIDAGEIRFCRFDLEQRLQADSYFLNLTCESRLEDGQLDCLDKRLAAVEVTTTSPVRFDGITNLSARFEASSPVADGIAA